MIWLALALCAWAGAFAYAVNRWAFVALANGDVERVRTLANERALRTLAQPAPNATRLASAETRLDRLETLLPGAQGQRDVPVSPPASAEVLRPPFGKRNPDDPPNNGGAA